MFSLLPTPIQRNAMCELNLQINKKNQIETFTYNDRTLVTAVVSYTFIYEHVRKLLVWPRYHSDLFYILDLGLDYI